MSHPTETGAYPSMYADNGSTFSASVRINHPLPWIVICCISSFVALTLGITNAASMQKEIDAAKQEARDAGTHALLLRDHVEKLRFELASHGIKPPEYSDDLKKRMR